MTNLGIEEGLVHQVTEDIRTVLISNPELMVKWNKLTSLARNEWICWTTIVKQEKTRKEHLERLREDILGGKKRPCCWPGCPHRNPKIQKWIK